MPLAVVGKDKQTDPMDRERKAFRSWLKKQVILYLESHTPVHSFVLMSQPWEEADLRLPIVVIIESKEPADKVLMWCKWMRGESFHTFWVTSADEAVRLVKGFGF